MIVGTSAEPDRMQCLEVWGGNSPVDRCFQTPGLEVWVYNRPYAEAEGGGDVYYVSSCASGRITRLLLADVSGHGDAVSSLAVSLRNLMRRHVNIIDQSRFVQEMNLRSSHHLDEDCFATALVCTFFSPTRSLQICNAGHPYPMIYRRKNAWWTSHEELAVDDDQEGLVNFPLGVTDEADYSRFETKLSAGDMVLCVSDAFTEARDEDGNQLGTRGLAEVVRKIDAPSPAQLIPSLFEELAKRQPDNLRDDDATILLFRAVRSRPSWKDNLLSPFRLFRRVRDNTQIHSRLRRQRALSI